MLPVPSQVLWLVVSCPTRATAVVPELLAVMHRRKDWPPSATYAESTRSVVGSKDPTYSSKLAKLAAMDPACSATRTQRDSPAGVQRSPSQSKAAGNHCQFSANAVSDADPWRATITSRPPAMGSTWAVATVLSLATPAAPSRNARPGRTAQLKPAAGTAMAVPALSDSLAVKTNGWASSPARA